jgi:hypothetical protein
MKKILLSAVLVASGWVLFAQDTTNRTNTTTTDQQMNTTTNQNNQMSSTSNYSAYAVPNYVQVNFQTQNPGVTGLTWDRPTADWYHGYYLNNGRYTHVYYSTDPYYNVKYYPERVVGYTVSLPVLQTYVPDNVIAAAVNQFKQNLYDITAMKGNPIQDNTTMTSNTQDNTSVQTNNGMQTTNNMQANVIKPDIYLVRILDNGELKSMWIDANGVAVTNVWRTEEQMNTTDVNTATSTDTNAAMTNDLNTKTKVKTKTSDGQKKVIKQKNGKTTTKTSNGSEMY